MAEQPALESFRDWMLGEYRPDGKWESVRALEGDDARDADLIVQLDVGKRSWYEARVVLGQEVQVGFATEGRVINEEIEQMILDNGGDLDDLLGDELCDLGEEPLPMEHFFERPAFRYIVRLPLTGPASLQDSALRKRVKAVVKSCHILFQGCVDEA